MCDNEYKKSIQIEKCEMEEIEDLVKEHMQGFVYKMDSWPEERLVEREKYVIGVNKKKVGYAIINGKSIYYFYVNKENFQHAPLILEELIAQKDIVSVFVLTQDALLSALIAEWDFEKNKLACGLSDREKDGRLDVLDSGEVFRVAVMEDCEEIKNMSGEFFDEPGAGFSCLEDRIAAGIIFVLTSNGEIMGGGIMERSQLFKGTVSIGMYTNSAYRKKGIAKKTLLQLKKQAYLENLNPVAGCWFYNTLSRKSLEAAGMMVTSICYEAVLKGKEKLVLKSGNPPSEMIAEK